MTFAPLRDAEALAHRALHAADAGLSVYRNLGFRTFGTMKQYGRTAQPRWSPRS